MTLRKTDWTGVAFGTLLGTLAAYQQFKLPPVLPLMLDQYHYDRVVAGGFMSIYAVIGFFFSIWAGRALARRGMAPVLLFGFALMLAGNALGLAAPQSGGIMLAGRGLEGAAFAILALVGPIHATASASERHLPLAVALAAAWIPNGQIIAGLMAHVSLQAGLWQPLWWGGIAFTAGLLIWTSSLSRNRRLGERPIARTAASEGPQRLSRGQLIAMILASLTFTAWGMQYFAFMTWLPEYLVEVHGLTPDDAVLGYLVPVVTLLIFVFMTGFIMRAGISIMTLLIVTLALQVAVWLVLPYVTSPVLGGLLLVLWGSGAGVTPTCLFAMPTRIAHQPALRPHAFGILMTGRNLGVLGGPLVLATALDLVGSWDVAAPVCAAMTAAALLFSVPLAFQLRALGVPAGYGTKR
ncbi:MAG: MFS transporter [Alphaproteobacteria bacterium]|nr:MFS transporter [Alphaproteobacteria bacterium]